MTSAQQSELARSRPASHDGSSNDAAVDQHDSPLRSVYTDSVPGILSQLRASLVVTTYQAGFLIVLRADGVQLNTHFRRFPRPMGMAAYPGRIALGAAREVIEFRDMAALAQKLEPRGKHDGCYLPRKIHLTGDIDIHEMAYSRDADLWFVNTRFSCLCTLDGEHSFVPRWRPSFVSAYSPEDRCHLNGLGMVDGQPRFVTALGATDSSEGWRSNKATGGVLVDIDSGETIAGGLSMPHSPRWHQDRLWMLESGDGSLGTVDMATGTYEAVARLGGFTRGLSFLGPYAFVGLSQVRDSALFSGLPLTDRLKERTCGISIVDLRLGREVGFVHFQSAVQEVFSVQVVPHCFPELLEPGDQHVGNAYALPDAALAEVRMRGGAEASGQPRPSADSGLSQPAAG